MRGQGDSRHGMAIVTNRAIQQGIKVMEGSLLPRGRQTYSEEKLHTSDSAVPQGEDMIA
jgi:hypothetical protein